MPLVVTETNRYNFRDLMWNKNVKPCVQKAAKGVGRDGNKDIEI